MLLSYCFDGLLHFDSSNISKSNQTERSTFGLTFNYLNFMGIVSVRSHGVMVSTLDSESSDPSSNLGGTSNRQFFFLFILNMSFYLYRYFSYTIENTSNP